MSLLLKAFPHGRPRRPRAPGRPRTTLAIALTAALVVVALPAAGSAQARQKQHHHRAHHASHHAAHHAAHRAKAARAHKKKKPPRPPRIVGQPARNYAIPQGSFFSFPNKGKKARQAIRSRVLYTIQSVWGGPRDAYGAPRAGNGTIRIATWSFDDWAVARALVAAKKRGVSVQIVGAKKANRGHASWSWLRKKLGPQTCSARTTPRPTPCGASPGSAGARAEDASAPPTRSTSSSTTSVPGTCRHITVQTSMNLTTFASSGQWNQAQVAYSRAVWNDFYVIFRQSRLNQPVAQPYRVKRYGYLVDYFFPRYSVTPATDPVSSILNGITSCYGATAGGTGRTQDQRHPVRHLRRPRGVDLAAPALPVGARLRRRDHLLGRQQTRSVHPAQRLRSWRHPDAPVRDHQRLRHHHELQPQQVDDDRGALGHEAGHLPDLLRFGQLGQPRHSATTSRCNASTGVPTAAAHLSNFAATWRQSSSHMPGYGVLPEITGRVIPYFARDVPESAPTWGRGVFRYMTPD